MNCAVVSMSRPLPTTSSEVVNHRIHGSKTKSHQIKKGIAYSQYGKCTPNSVIPIPPPTQSRSNPIAWCMAWPGGARPGDRQSRRDTTNISNHHHTTIDSRTSNVAKRLPEELYIMFDDCLPSSSHHQHQHQHTSITANHHYKGKQQPQSSLYNHYNRLQKNPPHPSKCFPSSRPPQPPRSSPSF